MNFQTELKLLEFKLGTQKYSYNEYTPYDVIYGEIKTLKKLQKMVEDAIVECFYLSGKDIQPPYKNYMMPYLNLIIVHYNV